MRSALLSLSRSRRLGGLATRSALTRPMAARFVSGQSLPEALDALERLHARGFSTTLDVLGESVASADAATAAAERYLEALDALAARGLDGNVSLKLSQMGMDVDPALCRGNVERVFRRAAETGAFVRIDMEEEARVEFTLSMWRAVRAINPTSGVVILAALRRSARDVDELVAEGAPVRLCKGAYKELDSVAYSARADVDASYVTLLGRLLLGGAPTAIATHDPRLIKEAIRLAREHSIPLDRFEFQMLFGVKPDLQERLLSAGYRVRLYVPYGRDWYPYFMRRLAERPANVMNSLWSVVTRRTHLAIARQGRLDWTDTMLP